MGQSWIIWTSSEANELEGSAPLGGSDNEAMKEDILEQVTEDWLISQPGWFAKHNLRYRPVAGCESYNSKHDSVNSDIDILAVHGTHTGVGRVMVVTCKSWQNGFDPRKWRGVLEGEADVLDRHTQGKYVPREKWKYFRELVSAKWMDAFLAVLERETGQRDFTYTVAVTRLLRDPAERAAFEQSEVVRQRFLRRGSTMTMRIITLEEVLQASMVRLSQSDTPVLEATDAGRFLQLVRAAGLELKPRVAGGSHGLKQDGGQGANEDE